MGDTTRKPLESESRTCIRGCVHHSIISGSSYLGFPVCSSSAIKAGDPVAKFDQILRTYVHQEYKAGCPRSRARRMVRSCHLGTLVAFYWTPFSQIAD